MAYWPLNGNPKLFKVNVKCQSLNKPINVALSVGRSASRSVGHFAYALQLHHDRFAVIHLKWQQV